MKWSQHLTEERGKLWTDYISEGRSWRCAQGYNDDPKKPWVLLHRERWKSDHASLSEAKDAAEATEEA